MTVFGHLCTTLATMSHVSIGSMMHARVAVPERSRLVGCLAAIRGVWLPEREKASGAPELPRGFMIKISDLEWINEERSAELADTLTRQSG